MEPVLDLALASTLILKFAIGLLVSWGDKVEFGF